MNAGPLDQRVRFEQKSITRDPAMGNQRIGWVPIDTTPEMWARCTDMRESARGGDEQAVQNQRIVQARTTVLVRWRADISLEMRVVWIDRDRTLSIVSQAETGRRDGLELSCEEFQP